MKLFSIFTLGSLLLFASCSKNQPANVVHNSTDIFVDSVLQTLTLEQKIGQMTNLTLSTIAKEKDSVLVLDEAKLKEVFIDRHIGSIQNVISHGYTINQWHDLISKLQQFTLEKSSHKIPFLYCIDAVHGTNYTIGSTLFPHNLALAATRNRSLLESVGQITAMETRASGIHYNFSPVLDCGREQMWSRFAETFGEDIYLVSELGAANIKGLEGDDISDGKHVAACMKHFVGYGVPLNGRDRAPAYIPEVNLREYFLPSFQRGTELGTRTLMVNSGEVNGVPVHASRFLLTDVLRNEMGYKGIVITDWQDIIKLQERHQVAENHKEAVFLSVNAGIDMCIVPFDFSFYDDLLALVKEGRISEERINQSVKRIIALKKELGLFENPYVDKTLTKNFATPESKKIALETARQALTLLKNNDGILPLNENQKILVTGPMANSLTALNGAWSYTWQGQDPQYFDKNDKTIAQALSATFKNATFLDAKTSATKLKAQAKSSDAIVVCLGEEAYAETPGNSPTIELENTQLSLFKELATTGKPIILVLVEGRPRIIREIEPYCSAVVMAYWPSSYGSIALGEMLAGEYSPSGKLPFTYPRYAEERITYDHKKLSEAVEVADPYNYSYAFNPQYEFGNGLSYTSFEYSPINLAKDILTASDTIVINIKIANTGKFDSYHCVEVYTRDHFASLTPSVKRLREFDKQWIKAGEEKNFTFKIPTKRLSFIGQDMKPVLEDGKFDLMIGNQKKEFVVKTSPKK